MYVILRCVRGHLWSGVIERRMRMSRADRKIRDPPLGTRVATIEEKLLIVSGEKNFQFGYIR